MPAKQAIVDGTSCKFSTAGSLKQLYLKVKQTIDPTIVIC